MAKTLLLAACTSALALSGCAMGFGSASKDRKLRQREDEDFTARVTNQVKSAEKQWAGALPDSLDDLRHAYLGWMDVYRSIEMFRTNHEYAMVDIGDCSSPTRKDSEHCREAEQAEGKVAIKIAEVLHAAIELDPEPASAFPAQAITEAQGYLDIAEAVAVEPSITKLVDQWTTYWSRRMRKAGGAANLARKEGTGMCFLSEAPHGKEVKPKFALPAQTEDVFVRCVAADAFRSYERTQQDTVYVSLIGGAGDNESDQLFNVKEIPIDDIAVGQSMELDVSASLLHKKIRSTLLSKDLKQRYKNWRYILVDVQYVVAKKVGVKERYSNSDRLELIDDIHTQTVARGVAVMEIDGDGDRDRDDDDGDDSDDAARDDIGQVAPPAKITRPATTHDEASDIDDEVVALKKVSNSRR